MTSEELEQWRAAIEPSLDLALEYQARAARAAPADEWARLSTYAAEWAAHAQLAVHVVLGFES